MKFCRELPNFEEWTDINLTLLLVGFLEDINWWGGGGDSAPLRPREP